MDSDSDPCYLLTSLGDLELPKYFKHLFFLLKKTKDMNDPIPVLLRVNEMTDMKVLGTGLSPQVL